MSTAHLSDDDINDFMAMEEPMLELLRSAVSDLLTVKVLSAADLDGVKAQAQHTPALHLLYRGFRPMESQVAAAGVRVRVEHTWLLIAVTKNVATVRSGKGARADAAPLLARGVLALAGVALPGATKRTELATAPAPVYDAGHLYLPAAFKVESLFQRTNP